MSDQDNKSKTVNINHPSFGGHGGSGGEGYGNGGTGGRGGTGEGGTMKIETVQQLTYVNQGHGLKEVLEKWLGFLPDVKGKQHDLRKLRHEATGDWLLRDVRFVHWKDTPSSLWIKGISGTGKSVLSSTVIATVIEEIVVACPKQSAVAYFYFDFRNEKQLGMDIMLRSIIWQISGQSPSPYRSLEKLYIALANGTIHPQVDKLEKVLMDLLSELNRTYIIIDGLNECNTTDWDRLVKFLCSLCRPAKDTLHLLFTSQPLGKFKNAFQDVTFIELDSRVSNDDIRSFIGSEVLGLGNWASDDHYANNVTEQIVQKSNGMFRLAACLLIELGRCDWEDDWDEILMALPADLFAIYNRFFTQKDTTPKRKVFIQAVLRWLVFSARQLTSDELADAIAFRLDDPAFDFSEPAKSIYYPNRRQGNSSIFKSLEGLIVIKNERWDRSIAFAHSSVRDYILSGQFWQQFGSIINLRKDVSHRFITQTCVRYLLLFADPKHLITKDTLPEYPLSLYAAKFWFYHLRLCDDRDQEALLPSTMCLLEDGSSQYAALYQLHHYNQYWTQGWDEPISPALCMCSRMGYTEGVHSLLTEHNTPVDLVDKDGQTALHIALRHGHLDIARLLIEHNAPANLVNKYGWTVLDLALSNGHLNIARLLIEHRAPVDFVDKYGWTALHRASSNGHLDIARLLIEYNAPVYLVDEYDRTPLHLALSNGHLDIARLLIEHNAPVNLVDEDGRTALHRALSNGHLAIARLLIKHNAPVNLVDEDGWTALHLALSNGQLDIARLLLEHNAPVDLVDKYGQTVLHLASSNGHLDIVKLLIEHSAPVDLVDEYGRTALHLALSNSHLNIVRLLIEHNAPVDLVDEDGRTALHQASSNGHLNIERLLIEHNAPVDFVDEYGWTALHRASSNGHLDIARLLIEHNAPVNLVDEYGWTALHRASSNGHLDITRLLIRHNAPVDLVNKDGQTALHLALSSGHLDIARLLIKHNAPVNLVDEDGQTVLHRASSNGHLDIARLLIKHNTPVNLVDEDGWTALHLASSNGHLEIAKLLIKHSAPVNLVDEYGQTALHLALNNGHLNIARLLIEHNTPVDLVDKYGQTALHLALRNGHLDIARLLIEHNTPVNLVNKDGQTALH